MTSCFSRHRGILGASILAVALSAAGSVSAQTTGSIIPNQPAASAPSPGNPDGLAPGETGLDEKAARQRLSDAGYEDIKALMLDAQGIWRGTARKDAMTVTVALDRRGKIVAH